jgi:hypothetical protein
MTRSHAGWGHVINFLKSYRAKALEEKAREERQKSRAAYDKHIDAARLAARGQLPTAPPTDPPPP